MRFYIFSNHSEKAAAVWRVLQPRIEVVETPQEADCILALGGDGLLIDAAKKSLDYNLPIYGINCGTVGFLLNDFDPDHEDDLDIVASVIRAKRIQISPLLVELITDQGLHWAYCLNEVSAVRALPQSAKFSIHIDGVERLKGVSADGLLISTPVGSTAYNFSAGGPIIPLGANVLSMMPLAPFRPRHWKGNLILDTSTIHVKFLELEKRPVNVSIDHTIINNVSEIRAFLDRSKKLTILFDHSSSLEEKILMEAFNYV